MKHLSTLLCILLLSSPLVGQNIMFLDFEKYNSYTKSKAHLISNPKVDLLHEQQGDLMLLEISGFMFRYEFFETNLYQITMTKSFENLKAARSAEKGCLRFFQFLDGTPAANSSRGNTRQYVVIKEGRVLELLITYHNAKDITFELSSKFVEHTPIYDMDKYCDRVRRIQQADGADYSSELYTLID